MNFNVSSNLRMVRFKSLDNFLHKWSEIAFHWCATSIWNLTFLLTCDSSFSKSKILTSLTSTVRGEINCSDVFFLFQWFFFKVLFQSLKNNMIKANVGNSSLLRIPRFLPLFWCSQVLVAYFAVALFSLVTSGDFLCIVRWTRIPSCWLTNCFKLHRQVSANW